MIKEFVSRWEDDKGQLEQVFKRAHPDSYTDIVKGVIEVITGDEYDELSPDPERIHRIDDGDYQGTLVFVIAEKGYQPSTYLLRQSWIWLLFCM